jgi:hypothetical protein
MVPFVGCPREDQTAAVFGQGEAKNEMGFGILLEGVWSVDEDQTYGIA